MKLNLTSNHWIIISIILLGLTSYPYKELSVEKTRVLSEIKSAQTKNKDLNKKLSSLNEYFDDYATDIKPRDINIVERLNWFRRSLNTIDKFNLSITSAFFSQSNGDLVDINSVILSNSINTEIKYIDTTLFLNFIDYNDLNKYIEFLKNENIAIRSIYVEGVVAKLKIEIYGI